jgi:hypothetical protein
MTIDSSFPEDEVTSFFFRKKPRGTTLRLHALKKDDVLPEPYCDEVELETEAVKLPLSLISQGPVVYTLPVCSQISLLIRGERSGKGLQG